METINLKLGDIKEPLPEKILQKFKEKTFAEVNHYPENYDSLISILAEKNKVGVENIVLTNGVDEGIELSCRLFGENVLYFAPSYFEFWDAPRRNGKKFTAINSFDGKEYKLSYKDEDIKDRSLIYLCHPNNPLGLLERQEILDLAEKTNGGGIVVIDETYIGFNGESVLGDFKNYPNLVVLRSFSKQYSIAGLRIGYAVAGKKIIDKIKGIKLYANVTSVSVNAAKIVLEEEEYFNNLIKKIQARKDKFENFLIEKGFPVIKTKTNNVVIGFRDKAEADMFNEFLKENKVIVNQGDGVSTIGLDESFIRFACGTEEQMQKVTEIVSKYKIIA